MNKRTYPEDSIDRILQQWSLERPELDTAAMGIIGRLKRCSVLIQRRLETTFAEHSLSAWEFDVLATLRRSGRPYRLAPTVLFSSLMVTSGTMTSRLQKLEQSGLVVRPPNPEDARSTLVELTSRGLQAIDAAVSDHVRSEEQMLASLNVRDRGLLDKQLRILLNTLER